jgi:serine/threonine protein kinase
LHNYRLHEQIGQEELATVYLATHLTLERPVQIHILRRTDWVSVSRFTLAARLAAHLSHANLLPVIDADHDEVYGDYLVTPMLEGKMLDEVLEQQGPLDPVLALKVVSQIAAVLDYLHANGVVHRDVQPSNVLITSDGIAYLKNLGLAASPDTPDLSSVDETDYLTPYSAPEQRFDQSEASPSLDVYGLGSTVYHMLSGISPPVHGMDFPPLASHDPLFLDADGVVQRMMATDPAARFASAGEAATALRRALQTHVDRSTDDMEESRWEPAAEWLENPVETVMGELLNQDYIGRSHARADTLHRAEHIRRLLSRWSRKGFFRRSAFGHVIELDQVVSYNIYFYELNTVYETRTPLVPRRRPQQSGEYETMLPMPELWDATIPETPPLSDVAPQEVVLPNSKSLHTCSECAGEGKIACKTCAGKGNIERNHKVRAADGTTKIETTQEMCPTCRGYRQQTCPICEGQGNLIEECVFTWSRRVCIWRNTDDIEELPRLALQKRLEPVYRAPVNPYDSRWYSLAPLDELMRAAIGDVGSEDTRIIEAELVIQGVPMTEIDYRLNDKSRRLYLIGYDNEIVGGWSLYNIERIILVGLGLVVLLTAAVFFITTVLL